MIFVEDNGPVNPDALEAFERQYGLLPKDYRNFISAHNGGELSDTAVFCHNLGSCSQYYEVKDIMGIADHIVAGGFAFQEEFWTEVYPSGTMPVAEDEDRNMYLMGLREDVWGKIYYFDHELLEEGKQSIEAFPCLAESLTESPRNSSISSSSAAVRPRKNGNNC